MKFLLAVQQAAVDHKQVGVAGELERFLGLCDQRLAVHSVAGEVRKAKAFGVNSKTGRCLNGSTQFGSGE